MTIEGLRHLVRPVITVGLTTVVSIAFLKLVFTESLPSELVAAIIGMVITGANTAFAFWFAGRVSGNGGGPS